MVMPSYYQLAIDDDGQVTSIFTSALFLPGTDVPKTLSGWLRQVAPDVNAMAINGEVGFTDRGLEVWDGDTDAFPLHFIRVPWRIVAPYIRPDGPLGSVLQEAGLTLAPVGTRIAPPIPVIGITNESRAELMAHWRRWPRAMQTGARFFGASLRFPAGTPRADVQRLATGRDRVVDTVWEESSAEFITAELTSRMVVPVLGSDVVLPRGTLVVAAEGSLHDGVSSLVSLRHQVFVEFDTLMAPFPTREAWFQPGSVQRSECGFPTREGAVAPLVRGVATIKVGGSDTRVAWFVEQVEPETRVVVAELVDCVPGRILANMASNDWFSDIAFGKYTTDGDSFVAIVSMVRDQPETHVLRAYRMGEDTPLLERTTPSGTLTTDETHAADGSPGYFPIVFRGPTEEAWFTWNGTGFDQANAVP